MKNRRRPSWSNILAVIVALWFGATCFSGCTYVAAPTPVAYTAPCILVTRIVQTDTLIVGVYDPPCGEDADTVMYWKINAPFRCPLVAHLDLGHKSANVSDCPPLAPTNPLPRG